MDRRLSRFKISHLGNLSQNIIAKRVRRYLWHHRRGGRRQKRPRFHL